MDGSESAFPVLSNSGIGCCEFGLTKREYFAAKILAAMSARDTFDPGQATPQRRAKLALIDADALIAALKGE